MKHLSIFAILFTLLLGAAPRAEALTARQILAEVERRENGFDDQSYLVRMTIRNGDEKQVVKMKMIQKGRNKRLMRFLSAGDKGLRMLVPDKSRMYIYLPQYRRIRRVALHAKKQTFKGSDFTFDDMAVISFSDNFKPSMHSQTKGEYVLWLSMRKGGSSMWYAIKVWICRKNFYFKRIEYFDKDRKLIRTQVRSDVKYYPGNKMLARRMEMIDNTRDHSTVLKILKASVNSGISDRLFRKRTLIRGNF